ncbi:hypothetical protein Nepgr_000278 [Nepenthes gracilis]|uniref:C2H2-type domain-containing protein n=1 Tax=Nepenthes gracilis TaxID=150966 RepID=A0AAD3P2S7_NEPGR|nr:hypothetical protein Nepgr_000278 [Nepenthes gracilis]
MILQPSPSPQQPPPASFVTISIFLKFLLCFSPRRWKRMDPSEANTTKNSPVARVRSRSPRRRNPRQAPPQPPPPPPAPAVPQTGGGSSSSGTENPQDRICGLCQKVLSSGGELQAHIQTHRDKPTFSINDVFDAAMETHGGRLPDNVKEMIDRQFAYAAADAARVEQRGRRGDSRRERASGGPSGEGASSSKKDAGSGGGSSGESDKDGGIA